MEFSAVSTLRSITKLPFLLLLAPYTLHAMEEENTSTHDQELTFSNAFEIRAIAKFHALSGKEKDFARYIAPRSIDHDSAGNVHAVDVRNISIKTDKYPPMFNVLLEPVAINLRMHQMKLLCTTLNQYDLSQTVTIEMMVPLDKEYSAEIPLSLNDETGQKVLLSIQTTAQ